MSEDHRDHQRSDLDAARGCIAAALLSMAAAAVVWWVVVIAIFGVWL